MAETFELEICTPERLLVRERVTEVQIPAANGYMGVLPGHAALLTELGTGEMTYTAEGRKRHLSLHGGFAEVTGAYMRVLSDSAEHADEIDVARAEAAFKKAKERLSDPGQNTDVARAINAMKRAEARLKAARNK